MKISLVIVSILMICLNVNFQGIKIEKKSLSISGIVKTSKGLPIENVNVDCENLGYTTTDETGYFELKTEITQFVPNREKNVIYFYKSGYKPVIEVINSNISKIEKMLTEQNKLEQVVPICSRSNNINKLAGDLLKFRVPSGFKFNKGFDTDYGYFSIKTKKNKQQYSLKGMDAYAILDYPSDCFVIESDTVEFKLWKIDENFAKDISGKLKNGNYWRHFGYSRDYIEYYDVPKDVAFEFDKIIESVCYIPR